MEDIGAGETVRRVLTATALLMLSAAAVVAPATVGGRRNAGSVEYAGVRSAPAPAPETVAGSKPEGAEAAEAPGGPAAESEPEPAAETIERLLSGNAGVIGEREVGGQAATPASAPRTTVQGSAPSHQTEQQSNTAAGRVSEKRPSLRARVVGRLDSAVSGEGWVLRTEPWGRIVRVSTERATEAPESVAGPAPTRFVEVEGELHLEHNGKRYAVIEAPWDRPPAATGTGAEVHDPAGGAVEQTVEERRKQQ